MRQYVRYVEVATNSWSGLANGSNYLATSSRSHSADNLKYVLWINCGSLNMMLIRDIWFGDAEEAHQTLGFCY